MHPPCAGCRVWRHRLHGVPKAEILYTIHGGRGNLRIRECYIQPHLSQPIHYTSNLLRLQDRSLSNSTQPWPGIWILLFSLLTVFGTTFPSITSAIFVQKIIDRKKYENLLGIDVSTMCKSQTVKKTNKDGKPRRKYQRRAEKPLIPRPKRALTAFNIYTGKDASREPWQEGVIRRLLLFFDQSTSA